MKLELTSTSPTAGQRCFVHRIGDLRSGLDTVLSEWLAELVSHLTFYGERSLIAFCPTDESTWQRLSARGWTTLIERAEMRTGWRVLRSAWVVGYAHNFSKQAEVLQFGWNHNHNDPLIAVPAAATDDGSILTTLEENGQVWPGNEETITGLYPTVVSRYFDGLWLTIATSRHDAATTLRLARTAADSRGLNLSIEMG